MSIKQSAAQQQWHQHSSVTPLSDWSCPLESFCSGWKFIHDTQGWQRLVIENDIITETFCHACCIHSLCALSLGSISQSIVLNRAGTQDPPTPTPTELLSLLTLNYTISHFNNQSAHFLFSQFLCLHHSHEAFNNPSRNQWSYSWIN